VTDSAQNDQSIDLDFEPEMAMAALVDWREVGVGQKRPGARRPEEGLNDRQ
jgi:hypothetical protein